MHLQGILGIVLFLGIAWALSERKKDVKASAVAIGVVVQFAIALVLLKVPIFKDRVFPALNGVVLGLADATKAGTSFVFGYVGGGGAPFKIEDPNNTFSLAFQALPLLLVIGAVASLLFYWNILPHFIRVLSLALEKTMKVGGALALGASTTIFLGMSEAPLVIKPYLGQMTRSELFSMMSVGMTCIAGTVLGLYAFTLKDVIPDATGHLLVASFIHVAAAITIARIMIPESGSETAGRLLPKRTASSAMDAIVQGTSDGLGLLLNISAMLIVMVALVSLTNMLLGLLPVVSGAPLTLERILGTVMAPVVWLFGIPWAQAQTAGSLMGTKTILNEFLAFINLSHLPPGALDDRSRLIMTYALTSFANFGSVGILIGSLTSLIPERRAEVVGLGMKALVAGTLATCMSGAVIGLLI